MLGKIKRQELLNRPVALEKPDAVCPLCQRGIPKSQMQAHHWIPKSKGGSETAFLHAICHRQLHALFTENELAQTFNTPESLRADERFAKFVTWVQGKAIDFKPSTRKSNRLIVY